MSNTELTQRTPREALVAIIAERGLRQDALAKWSGIPRSSLSRVISGHRTLSPHYAALLARALCVPVETFLAEEAS